MKFLNNSKESLQPLTLALSYPSLDEELMLFENLIKILQICTINYQINSIHSVEDRYSKFYEYGISADDLSIIKNANFFISFENKYPQNIKYYNFEDYLDIAVHYDVAVDLFFNINNPSNDIIICSPAKSHFSNFCNKATDMDDPLISKNIDISDKLLKQYNRKNITIIYDDKYSNIPNNAKKSNRYIAVSNLLKDINQIELESVILVLSSNKELITKIILGQHSELQTQRMFFPRTIKINFVSNQYHFYCNRNDVEINYNAMLFLVCDILKYSEYETKSKLLRQLIVEQISNPENSTLTAPLLIDNIINGIKKNELITALIKRSYRKIEKTNKDTSPKAVDTNPLTIYIYLNISDSVKNIVGIIRNRMIPIPDNFSLKKIYSNGIEVFPNEAFWNDHIDECTAELTLTKS